MKQETITEAEVREAANRQLQDLGLSFAELQSQAKAGRFQSERARLLWLFGKDLMRDAG